jgi:GNAT superfamily N-acetyltransferase
MAEVPEDRRRPGFALFKTLYLLAVTGATFAIEVALTRDWAAAEGWNPGLHDAACFYETAPDGFFLGELDGAPIACLSCVAYDDAFGFVGHYIVRPAFRGQGYGIQLWRVGMAYLGTRNVGLDGVLAQVGNYERSGFALNEILTYHARSPESTP